MTKVRDLTIREWVDREIKQAQSTKRRLPKTALGRDILKIVEAIEEARREELRRRDEVPDTSDPRA